MIRKFKNEKLVIGSHNKNKVLEIEELLKPYNIEVISSGELNLPIPEETGKTFSENAIIKAKATTKATGLPSIADDSGLVVHSLNGQPGIFSARWAMPNGDFGNAIKKVHNMLNDKEDKTAHFVCALALFWPDNHYEIFEGKIYGKIVWPPRGKIGFGYDPIFLPKGQSSTFGETTLEVKKLISHRAKAFRKLVTSCFT